jgi:hypothetical protein
MPTCSGPNCGAEIVWAETIKGKRIPLDAKSEKRIIVEDFFESEDEGGQSGYYVKSFRPAARFVDTFMPHHATCPDVQNFRKKAAS